MVLGKEEAIKMMDEVNQEPNRREYSMPKLISYGNLVELTRMLGTKATPDGGPGVEDMEKS